MSVCPALMMSGGFPCICNLKKNKPTCGEQTPRKPKQNSVGSGSLTCGERGRGRGPGLPCVGGGRPHGGESDRVRGLLGQRGRPQPRAQRQAAARRRRLQLSAVARAAAARESGKGPTSYFQRQDRISDKQGSGEGSTRATFPEFSTGVS